jgi:DNA-binding MarR family transcriptional regulator
MPAELAGLTKDGRRMTNKYDDDTERVLDVLLNSPGQRFAQGYAGEVLGNLAAEAGVEYKITSKIVIMLETMGWVHVERQTHDDPRRANRIISIEVVD